MLYALIAVLIVFLILKIVQRFTRAPGRRELLENGVVLLDNGLEFLGRFWRRRRVGYGDIESAAVAPWSKTVFTSYGPNTLVVRTRFSSKVLVVKVRETSVTKDVVFPRYLLFTPADPEAFCELLKRRMGAHNSPGLSGLSQ